MLCRCRRTKRFSMSLGNLFKIAFKAISSNRMRSFLTMLGIIIGVASVITMLGLGQGAKRNIQSQISEMGSNMIMISPGGDRRGGVMLSASDMQTLKVKDYEAIRDRAEYVSLVSPTVNSAGQVIYGGNNAPTTIYGVTEEYLQIRGYSVGDGELFSEQDVHSAAKVCVVGATVVSNLFTNGENPVGKVIRFGTIPFRIIGVLESKGYNSMGMDQDDLIYCPYTSVMKRILAVNYIQGITCAAIGEDYTDQAISEIKEILREDHRIAEGEDDDFEVRSTKELADMMTSTTSLLTILLAAVAGISLVVGGIGIMNIMYVSVTERTKEIGLRMSIGAKSRDILAQFLIESILISITGGLIGVVLGIGAAYIVKWLASFPIYIELWTIALAFGICTFTGVFFGWYPARKASNLDPIEALRYE